MTNSLWKLQVLGWFIYFLLMFLTFLSRETDESLGYIFAVKSFRTIIGFGLSCLLWLIYQKLSNSSAISKTTLIVILASAFLGIVWTLIETLFFWMTLPDFDLSHSLQFKPRVALTYTVTLLAWSAIYFGLVYRKQVQVEQQNTLQAKILAETAQLNMLRYQVNPHFLFNALNSIRASIDPANHVPKQMITQLSEFLRHSLMDHDKKHSTLEEELASVNNYLAIEKIRFEESLQIEWDIEEKALLWKLPSFILNPLVENAIKHGFKTSKDTVLIKISAAADDTRLVVKVINSGELRGSKTIKSDRIGLNNVQQRLNKEFPNKSAFALYQENGFVLAEMKISSR